MSDDKDHEWLFDELAAEKAAHLATRQELSRALARIAEFERLQLVWLMSPEAAQRLDGYREVSEKCAELERERDEARAEVERLTRDLATAQSLLARTLGPDLDMVACMSVLLDASRAEVERLKARGEASWGHLTRLNAEWQEVYTATCDEALRLSAEVERLRADVDTLARRDATYWTQHCNAERKVEQLRAEKTLWQATLRETVATQKRERDAALESLRERCAAYAHDWVSDNVDSHVAAEAQAAIRAVPLVAP